MIKLPEGKKCYNAGKISGLSILGASAKFAKFDKFIATEMDMIPINPMSHGLNWDKPWLFHIIYDLTLMLRCDAVLFQPDWVESCGARIEHFFAKMFGIDVYYYRKSYDRKSKN